MLSHKVPRDHFLFTFQIIESDKFWKMSAIQKYILYLSLKQHSEYNKVIIKL